MKRSLIQQAIVEEAGSLTCVEYLYHADIPNSIGIIKFSFQQGNYFIVAKEDDSLKLTDKLASRLLKKESFISQNSSNQWPWQWVIGKPVRWVWNMVNQQGYLDGLQFEFSENVEKESLVIQLMAIASAIEVNLRINLNQINTEWSSYTEKEGKTERIFAISTKAIQRA